MADYDSSLPIRSEADGTDERVHVKIVDGSTPSQRATVDTDGNVHVEMHGNDPAGTDRVVRTSELGALTPDGVYDGSDNTKPGNVGLVASSRDAAPGDTTQTERLTSVTDSGGTVRALDVSLHDEDGEPYSQSNPLPVSLEESEGDEVHDYNTASTVAKDATSNHDYVVADGETFLFSGVLAAASGKMKIEIQIGDGDDPEVFATKAVRFNSTANPNCDADFFNKAIEVVGTANGTTVRIIRTNLDNQAQDLYTTIIGVTRT